MSKVEAHTTHCCPIHGCKYSEEDLCPIVNHFLKPVYSNNNGCEQCEDGHIAVTEKMCRAAFPYLYDHPRNPQGWEVEFQKHKDKIRMALSRALASRFENE